MDFHRIKNILEQKHTLPPDVWKGAVLFLANEEHVIFIKRSEKMPTHGGQMAFVGGHRLEHEADPWITVLREYTEETGLESTHLEFMGYLPVIMTARLQPIIPVMAKLQISLEQFMNEVKSNGEWDQLIVYPWKELTKKKTGTLPGAMDLPSGRYSFTPSNLNLICLKTRAHIFCGELLLPWCGIFCDFTLSTITKHTSRQLLR